MEAELNEMFERVEGAIHAARLNYDGVSGLDRTMTIAAFKALRECTPEMAEAGRVGRMDDGGVEGRWRMMIDVASFGS